jgi:ABC-2 type transport system ATP-binding protein
MVRDLAATGRTVLLTTHFMDEAHALADRLALLVDGRIVAEGTPAEVIDRHSAETLVRVRLPAGTPRPPDGLGLRPVADDPDWLEATTADATPLLHALTSWALDRSTRFADISVARPSLEDVYLALTGGRDGGSPAP